MVFSTSWEDHLRHLRDVLGRIRESGLTIKIQKCRWAQQTTEFLGHLVGGGTVRPTEAKTEAIREYERPKTKKQVWASLDIIDDLSQTSPEQQLR